MAHTVLITDRFSAEGVDRFRAAGLQVEDKPGLSGPALHEAIAKAQALVIRSQTEVNPALIEHARGLLVVGRAGVGYENIDIPACDAAGIAVLNTPGASSITTAERTLTLMLSLLHQVGVADRSMRAGKWDRRSFMGAEAFGKTIGVLGYGNVGRVVATRCAALGMKVLVHDPHVNPDLSFNQGYEPVGFTEIFKRSQIITCHVSADVRLRGLVGEKELALMPAGGWLINCSRGFIVDEAALVKALKSGHLKGAALDVFEQEPPPKEWALRDMDNVVLSPHLGASSTEAERRVSLSVAEQVSRFLLEGRAANLIGKPASYRHALANQK